MIAAKALILFDENNMKLGPHLGKRQRDQPAGQTATNDGNVAFDIFKCHLNALAQPFYKGKGSAKVIHSFLYTWCGDGQDTAKFF